MTCARKQWSPDMSAVPAGGNDHEITVLSLLRNSNDNKISQLGRIISLNPATDSKFENLSAPFLLSEYSPAPQHQKRLSSPFPTKRHISSKIQTKCWPHLEVLWILLPWSRLLPFVNVKLSPLLQQPTLSSPDLWVIIRVRKPQLHNKTNDLNNKTSTALLIACLSSSTSRITLESASRYSV